MRSIFAVLLVISFASCAEPEDVPVPAENEEVGSVTLSLSTAYSAINLSVIDYFRIRVYPSAPKDEKEATLFDSLDIHGCFKAGGTEIKIQDLKAGSDRFVYYEGFADANCSKRVAVGIRGGISIVTKSKIQEEAETVPCSEDVTCSDAVHPDAKCECEKEVGEDGKAEAYCKAGVSGFCSVSPPVFVPLYEVGKFNKLPAPSKELLAKATQVSCEKDDDCRDKVHAASTCDLNLGYCTVEGLFPFTPSRPRAFHGADVLGDGTVAFSGGFTSVKEGGDTFVADGPFFELYNPRSGLFEKAAVEAEFGGQKVAFHRTALLGNKLLVAGGISEATMEFETGAELKLKLAVPVTYDGCSNGECNNFSNAILSADFGAVKVLTGTLPRGVMAHRLGVVNQGSDPYVIVSGGMTYLNESKDTSASDRYVKCGGADIKAGDAIVCEESDKTAMAAPRYAHADACLVPAADGDACDEYLLFGGVAAELPAGEEFSSTGEETFNKPLTFTEVTKLNEALFPLLAKVEGDDGKDNAKLYVFGGISAAAVSVQSTENDLQFFFSAPDIVPQKLTVNLTNSSMTIAMPDLTKLDSAGDVFRLFPTVSVEDGGRVMMAGGLGEDVLPTKSVLFFEDPNTDALTYSGKANLGEARFGHTATVLTSGLLKGAVLVVGGLTLNETKDAVVFAKSAEIYIP